MIEKDKEIKYFVLFFFSQKEERYLGGRLEEGHSWKTMHNRKQNCICSLTFIFWTHNKKPMESKM